VIQLFDEDELWSSSVPVGFVCGPLFRGKFVWLHLKKVHVYMVFGIRLT